MSAAVLPFKIASGFYSHDVDSALRVLSRLAECPVPATPNDQRFIDHLMAEGLRFAGRGLGNALWRVPQDDEGLAKCAALVDYLSERTTASFACEQAAKEIAALRGTPAPIAVINAAAKALDEAKR